MSKTLQIPSTDGKKRQKQYLLQEAFLPGL